MAERSSCFYLILATFWSFSVVSDCYSFHDEGEVVHHAIIGPNREIRRREIDQPIRITTVYRNISGLKDYQLIIVKSSLAKAVEFMGKALRVRKTVNAIHLQRKCQNNSYYIKNITGESLRYCHVSCDSSRPVCGFVTPSARDLDQCRICNSNGANCKDASGSENAAGRGYNNTDFVLFVTSSVRKCERNETIAYAAACQQEESLDRPVAGYLNVCPSKINKRKADGAELLATLKHEIFHALGFSPSLYAFYRDEKGEPLTPRLSDGMPEYNHDSKVHQWSDKVIKEVIRSEWMIRSDNGHNGTVRHKVHIMVTKRVREEARKHFNCSSLEGGELENQGSKGTALAHWEKRVFENEGMTGATTQNSVFSRITLALMEDTGWYKVDYSKAEPLRWGKNMGCLFAKNSCKAWMSFQRSANETISPFCDILDLPNEGKQTKCTVDHHSVAVCNLVEYTGALPLDYQYFESLPGVAHPQNYGGSVDLADYCPYFQALTWTKAGVQVRGSTCRFSENSLNQENNYGLEFYGQTSTCIEQGKNWSKTKCDVKWTARDWGSGCYNHKCDNDGLSIMIEGYKYRCFHKGQILHVRLQKSDGWDYKGSIVCPSCEEVCFDSGNVCPAEIKSPPANAQPSPSISEVTCAAMQPNITKLVLYVTFLFGLALMLQ